MKQILTYKYIPAKDLFCFRSMPCFETKNVVTGIFVRSSELNCRSVNASAGGSRWDPSASRWAERLPTAVKSSSFLVVRLLLAVSTGPAPSETSSRQVRRGSGIRRPPPGRRFPRCLFERAAQRPAPLLQGVSRVTSSLRS